VVAERKKSGTSDAQPGASDVDSSEPVKDKRPDFLTALSLLRLCRSVKQPFIACDVLAGFQLWC